MLRRDRARPHARSFARHSAARGAPGRRRAGRRRPPIRQAAGAIPGITAFPVQEGGAVDRVGQVECGVEQGFHAKWVERHREGPPRVGFPDKRNPWPKSLKNDEYRSATGQCNVIRVVVQNGKIRIERKFLGQQFGLFDGLTDGRDRRLDILRPRVGLRLIQ